MRTLVRTLAIALAPLALGPWGLPAALAGPTLQDSQDPAAGAPGGAEDAGPEAPEEPQARPTPDNRSSETHYVIRARLDDVDLPEPGKRLTGELTLRWVNHSQDSVSDLWFHLHHNAFSNSHSTHMLEAGGRLRSHLLERGWGWQRVTRIRAEGQDLTDRITFEDPDALPGAVPTHAEADDRTVFRVELDRSVPPGGELEVELTWESLVPRVRRRTGQHRDFLLMAHWFPKLGVYEGGRGWNCHTFHRDTEFYADFGTYDVTLDLPGKYARLYDETKETVAMVGASGVQVGAVTTDAGRMTVRYLAPGPEDRLRRDAVSTGARWPYPQVHGFAWTADPDFVVHRERFRFDEWKEQYLQEVQAAAIAFKKSLEEIRLRDVEIVVLIQPERADQAARHAKATAAALFFYGLWWGEYPYQQVTVVDPAWGARAAGGMEYPTLFTCGTQLFTSEAMHRPESVTVHEAGHQFWYGLVGNNEYEAAWLDEGLNSYTDSEVMARVYGPQRDATWYAGVPVWGLRPGSLPDGGRLGAILTGRRWDLPGDLPTVHPTTGSGLLDLWRDQPWLTFHEQHDEPRAEDRSGYLRDPDTDPIETWGFRYCNRTSYSKNSYARTAVALRSLAAVVGHDDFLRGMRHFSEQWRYRHPYPEDFYAAFQEGSGRDVQWYFEEVFQGTGTLDWSVTVSQPVEPRARGMFPGEDGAYRLVGEEPPPADPPVDATGPVAADDDPDGEGQAPEAPAPEAPAPRLRHYDVTVKRSGALSLPVDVLVTFEPTGEDEEAETRRFTWTREQQQASAWWRLPLEPGAARIASVVIDPERRYFLDGDLSNNQWYAERDNLAPWRWTERSISWNARVLQWFSRIGG